MRCNGSVAKRLYSFAIGRKHHEMALVKSQILNLDRVFVRLPCSCRIVPPEPQPQPRARSEGLRSVWFPWKGLHGSACRNSTLGR
jgi:hypothetical protein